MNHNFFYQIIFLFFISGIHTMQGQRTCGTMEALEAHIQSDSSIIQNMLDIENHTRRSLLNKNFRSNNIITIPVVVHVLYSNSTENISDAQILSQIEVLNEDFRRLNSNQNDFWPQADDMEIEFCLATIDPNGDPTCGIVRKSTWQNSFSSIGNPVKFSSTGGSNAWPTDEYLNIWVCDLIGLLGYAQFPGGAYETDGVVVNYIAFGRTGTATFPNHLGRTATHEVGHWLNLRHIWGDGDCTVDDFVEDTPPANSANYRCSGRGASCGVPEMYENFMDYSDDSCMRLFTTGQKDRMRALFEPGGFRESILTSRGCYSGPPCTPVSFNFQFDLQPEEFSWQIKNSDGDILYAGGAYETGIYANSEYNFDLCLEDGAYDFLVFDAGGNGGTGIHLESKGGTVNIDIAAGAYTSFKNSNLSISERTYIFKGPGTTWTQGSNWNKGAPPSPCFEGNILINSNCIMSANNPLKENIKITIANGAILTKY